MSEIELIPPNCITAKNLTSLALKMRKLEVWQKQQTGQLALACLRIIQASEKRITATIQSGDLNLKLAFRRYSLHTGEDDWIVLGDALRISD